MEEGGKLLREMRKNSHVQGREAPLTNVVDLEMVESVSLGMPSKEKRRIALTSVLASAFLVATKVTVGLLTGSLGILSEAAHSALDLLAAAITFFSVGAADVPADTSHPFGHGKVEQLSAFIQTGLLFITSGWIVVEAAHRLFFQEVHVTPSLWAFAVLLASIVIDISRSRALARAARKYDSQALQADALHFSTDTYGTGAVTLSLVLLSAAQRGLPSWLRHADPVSALVVAGITLYVGLRLGHETVDALLDAAPKGVSERIAGAVAGVPGVLHQDRIRVRRSGNRLFVDLRLTLESNIALEHAQAVIDNVESAVHILYPTADVVVDAAPRAPSPGDLVDRIRSIAHRDNFQIHDVTAFTVNGRVSVNLDLEMEPALPLSAAHDRATELERAIERELPEVHDVNVHIEPLQTRVGSAKEAPDAQTDVEEKLREIVRATPGVLGCHAVEVRRLDQNMIVTVHCTLRPGLPVAEAHDITERIELALRKRLRRNVVVNIHPEPQ